MSNPQRVLVRKRYGRWPFRDLGSAGTVISKLSETAWKGVNCITLPQCTSSAGENLLSLQRLSVSKCALFSSLHMCGIVIIVTTDWQSRTDFQCVRALLAVPALVISAGIQCYVLRNGHARARELFAVCFEGSWLLQERKHVIEIRYFTSLGTGFSPSTAWCSSISMFSLFGVSRHKNEFPVSVKSCACVYTRTHAHIHALARRPMYSCVHVICI